MERGFRGTLRIVLWTQFLAVNNVNLYRPTSQVPINSAMSIANPTRTWCIFALSSPPLPRHAPVDLEMRYRHSRPEKGYRTTADDHHPPSN